ncbi:MAG: SDR family NAD(P)-dependent oxidoreductase [Nitrospirota bacterium]|nr:SDR family NAD(P)-dependent oxidoreductase [Nitrospirota bacterium]
MVCLVTGSSRGLGRAIAIALGAKGHSVAVHYHKSREAAEETASKINEAMTLQADVRDHDGVKACVDTVIEKWGRIDVLVNNAGITKESLLIRTSAEDFDDIVDTNLKGPFNFIKAAARHMMKQKSGHIINISSCAGVKGKEGLSAYSASKAGLTGLTKTAAMELGRYNIMVNAVLPGYMLTDMGGGSTEKGRELALKESIVKEYSDPNNAAEFVCYLSQTKGVTGQVFNLDSRIL